MRHFASTSLVSAGWVLVLALLHVQPARGDVVSPPPEECLDGTSPQTGHCGPHCSPIQCETDANCTVGSCVEKRLCTTTIICAGFVAPGEDLSQYERLKATATCAVEECAEGECTTLRVCSTGTDTPSGTPSAGPGTTGSNGSPEPGGAVPSTIDPGSEQRGVSEDSGSDGCALTQRAEPAPRPWLLAFGAALLLVVARRRRAERTRGLLRFLILGGLLTSVSAAGVARADAIPPDPPCPPGQLSTPGGHQGSYCTGTPCTAHEQCPEDQACMRYCRVPPYQFGPTARCSSDADCDTFACVPSYCEVGPREAAPSTSASSETDPSSPQGSTEETTPSGAANSTHPNTRPKGVDEEGEGCTLVPSAGHTSSNTRWLAVSVALAVGAALSLRALSLRRGER